jgi:hypothetical protein
MQDRGCELRGTPILKQLVNREEGSMPCILMVHLAVALLYDCDQGSSPVERQEERAERPKTVNPAGTGQPEQTTTAPAVGNIPIAGVVGEAVEAEGYDLPVLDTFVTDHYYYATDPYLGEYQDAFPTAGQFLVVNYSVRNTGAQTVSPNLIGTLHVRAPDGKIEVYEQTDLVSPPPDLHLDDIPHASYSLASSSSTYQQT